MSTIANSTIKLSLDSTSVQRGVDAINKKFAGMGTAMKVGMAAAAAATTAYFKGFIDRMGEVYDMAQRLGASTDEVQRLGLVARTSGTDFESVAKAVEKVSVNMFKAAEGGEEAQKGLERLGLSAEAFVGLSLEEKVLKLAEAYSGSNRGAKELAGLQALIGRSAGELIPLLSAGPDALRESLAKVRPVAGQTVADMEALGDQMDALKQSFEYVFGTVIAYLYKNFQAFIAATTSDILALVKYAKGAGQVLIGDQSGAAQSFGQGMEIRRQGYAGAAEYLKPPPTSRDKMIDDKREMEALYESIKRDANRGKESGELFMAIKKLTAAIEGGDTPKFPR